MDATKKQLDMFQQVESISPHQLLMKQLLAGSCKFTLVSRKTGQRFTYWIRSAAKDRDKNWTVNNQDKQFYFVKLLTQPDNDSWSSYVWLASLRRHSEESLAISFEARNDYRTAPSRFAIEWFIRQVFIVGNIPADVEILWAGSCARCGRTLTVPESIKSGFGPECVGMMV